MNYEEKYKQALGWMQSLYVGLHGATKEEAEHYFPELKESEDEKHRKWILEYLYDGLRKADEQFKPQFESAINWLEKLGIQTTDKVEPKFKVGDWIVLPLGIIAHIDSLNSTDYQVTTIDGKICDFKISKQDNYRLWAIADAKDGDVLYSIDSKQPFIYKGRPQFSQARGYCCINKFGEFAIWNTSKCVICTDKYIPATKEQRDTLIKAMANAGYTFDFEKKELKKIKVVSKENKDEQIKKAIKSGIKHLETKLGYDAVDGVDILDIYSWLEKQGKQHPHVDVNKMVDKFAHSEVMGYGVPSMIEVDAYRRGIEAALKYCLTYQI